MNSITNMREILLYLAELELRTNKDIKKAFIERDSNIINNDIIAKINNLNDNKITIIKDLI